MLASCSRSSPHHLRCCNPLWFLCSNVSTGGKGKCRNPAEDGRLKRLSAEQIAAICETFAQTGDKTKTAKLHSVSRLTVYRALDGRKYTSPNQAEKLNPGEQCVADVRCPECRQKIQVIPCRICAAQAAQAITRLSQRPTRFKRHRRAHGERKRQLAASRAEVLEALKKRGLSPDDMFGDPFADDAAAQQAANPAPVQLQLFPGDYGRYEEVRKRREQTSCRKH